MSPSSARPDGRESATRKGAGGSALTEPWPLWQPARTRAERLALCERLRAESPTLRRVSARRLRHVLRPWLLAGWTVRGVQHALDHRPDGAPWRIPFRPGELGNPAGWVMGTIAIANLKGGVGKTTTAVYIRSR